MLLRPVTAVDKRVVDGATDLRSNNSFVSESLDLGILHVLRRSFDCVETYIAANDLNVEFGLDLL